MTQERPGSESEVFRLALMARLRSISHERVGPLLDAELVRRQAVDPKVGIVIAHLDDEPIISGEDGQEYKFHAARVYPSRPGEQNFVTPHLHSKGIEPYRFLTGNNAEMNTGVVRHKEVIWNHPREVSVGEEVIVQPGEVHSLRNKGDEPYDFVFACPDSHLKDHDTQTAPDGDRFIVKDYTNGIPPWYSE